LDLATFKGSSRNNNLTGTIVELQKQVHKKTIKKINTKDSSKELRH
jgi:hypothetical protein